jgi:phage I-like protein
VHNFNAWKAGGYEPPIDVEHAYAEGKPEQAKAVGYYKELVRKGKQLLARVAWTDEGKDEIRSGRRRYFSPEFSTFAQDETGKRLGAVMLSGSLVLRPHLKQLGAIAMSEEARTALQDEVTEMRDALDDLAALVAERPAQMAEDKNKTPAPLKLGDVQIFVDDSGLQAKFADGKTVTLAEKPDDVSRLADPPKPEDTETVVALKDTVTALSTRVEKAEGELFEERFTAFMSQARREGRIDAKEETTTKWRGRAEKLGLEECKSLMADIPAETIAMSERGHGGEGPPASADAEVPEGVDPDAHRLHERAVALAEEKNIEYADAVYMAAAEAE